MLERFHKANFSIFLTQNLKFSSGELHSDAKRTFLPVASSSSSIRFPYTLPKQQLDLDWRTKMNEKVLTNTRITQTNIRDWAFSWAWKLWKK